MKTVILSPDIVGPVKNGGIGTFATNLGFLLKQHGHDVTIIFTGDVAVPRSNWIHRYDEKGIDVVWAAPKVDKQRATGNYWFIQHSEAAWRAIPEDTQIIYTQDWRGNAFQLLRRRRYTTATTPTVVTVLHSPSAWLRNGMHRFPDDPEHHLAIDYVETYTAQHSDYVVAPSQYMMNWASNYGWVLPPHERRRILGYPFSPSLQTPSPSHQQNSKDFKRIIFFGRLETRKGLELFVDALRYCRAQLRYPLQEQVGEIVLLGKHEGQHRFSSEQSLLDELREASQTFVKIITDYSTYEAQQYLAENAPDSLVVMPSLVDNFPFTVIEASLIEGLNLITSRNGGMAEILGEKGQAQLFDPFVKPLAHKLVEWLQNGPKTPTELGRYDFETANRNWLRFHADLLATRSSIRPAPAPQAVSVDICIAHHNHGSYLKQLLHALEHQTVKYFGVIVVDDASTETASREIFQALADKYSPKGWQFIQNGTNEGLSQTRNIAAQHSAAETIIFMDADNLPVPHMVERMREAIQVSGADCLSCYAIAFLGDEMPYDPEQLWDETRALAKAYYRYLPLGAAAALGLFVNCFGDANVIIKREVLNTLGGFSVKQPEYRHIVGEDHALLADLVLSGYELDVIPDYLFFYRYRQDSLFRTTDTYANILRVQMVYREKLATLGLQQTTPLTYGLYERALEMPSSISYSDPDWLARRIPWRNMALAIGLKVHYFIQKRLRRD